jgi:hypothetical protein
VSDGTKFWLVTGLPLLALLALGVAARALGWRDDALAGDTGGATR